MTWLLIAGAVLAAPALLLVLAGALRAGRREDDLADEYRKERGQ